VSDGGPPSVNPAAPSLVEVADDDDEPILLEDDPADTTVLAKGQGDALLDTANDADDDHTASPNDPSALVPAPRRAMELSKKFPFTLFFTRARSEPVEEDLVQAIAEAAFIAEMSLRDGITIRVAAVKRSRTGVGVCLCHDLPSRNFMTDVINQFGRQRGIALETREIVVHQLIEVAMIIDSYLTTFSPEQVFASVLRKNPLPQTAVWRRGGIAHLRDGRTSYHYYVDDALLSALQAIQGRVWVGVSSAVIRPWESRKRPPHPNPPVSAHAPSLPTPPLPTEVAPPAVPLDGAVPPAEADAAASAAVSPLPDQVIPRDQTTHDNDTARVAGHKEALRLTGIMTERALLLVRLRTMVRRRLEGKPITILQKDLPEAYSRADLTCPDDLLVVELTDVQVLTQAVAGIESLLKQRPPPAPVVH
jgi:hypothetical protein